MRCGDRGTRSFRLSVPEIRGDHVVEQDLGPQPLRHGGVGHLQTVRGGRGRLQGERPQPLEQPTEGSVYLDDEPVDDVPPYSRNVNTVFQSYALFQHLDVEGNVAFGLKRRKVAGDEIRSRVALLIVGGHVPVL